MQGFFYGDGGLAPMNWWNGGGKVRVTAPGNRWNGAVAVRTLRTLRTIRTLRTEGGNGGRVELPKNRLNSEGQDG